MVSRPDSPLPPGLDDLTAACVHCGFCLPACPTYLLTGDENESPRGRIHLLGQVGRGAAELDAGVAAHVDACLGCLACVSACPSGVEYDRIIEAARPAVAAATTPGPGERAARRLIFLVFPRPLLLRIAGFFGVWYRRTGGARLPVARTALALLPDVRARDVLRRTPAPAPAAGTARRRVGLVTGCVQRVFFAEVNDATARVLAAEGCEVVAPRQGCCGALSLHAGRRDEARRYARRLIDAFERLGAGGETVAGVEAVDAVDAVVVNVAGCGSALKGYGELLADDPRYAERAAAFAARVRDVSEVLAELGEPRAPRHPLPVRVAYHDACHLGHGQGVRAEPRLMLSAIPGVEVVEPAEGNLCCGSAGIHNLVRPDTAGQLGRRKAERIAATGADLVATGNPGCLLQIRRYLAEAAGRDVPVRHPVQLVDASIRGVPIGDGSAPPA